ncbi:MAG: hypothetical protein L0154_19945 [Chloroflexi bacterium]|nr:hypothetical protein [Chloroflexota bacterium]
MSEEIKESSKDVLIALRAAIQAAYKLAPGAVSMMLIVFSLFSLIALVSSEFMVGCITMIVFFSALFLYHRTQNIGEAVVALSGGLLATFAVSWQFETFLLFSIAWVALISYVLLYGSISLASQDEFILRDAAIVINLSKHEEIEQQLRAIARKIDAKKLGPIERAQVLRYFAHRGLPVEEMEAGLRATDTLSINFDSEALAIAEIIFDVYTVKGSIADSLYPNIPDFIYDLVKKNRLLPEYFIKGFQTSRSLILSGTFEADNYFEFLVEAIRIGVDISDLNSYLKEKMK